MQLIFSRYYTDFFCRFSAGIFQMYFLSNSMQTICRYCDDRWQFFFRLIFPKFCRFFVSILQADTWVLQWINGLISACALFMVVRVDLCCCRENAGILLTVSFRVFQSFCSNVAGSSEFCRYAADRLLTALSEILQSFYRHHNNSYLQSYCRAIVELLQKCCWQLFAGILQSYCRACADVLWFRAQCS